jgi:two-component system response regulator AtoC
VLQDGQFSRLGDIEDRRVNARVICASNRRVEDAVQSGKFREDLYYRISVFNLELPRLAVRAQDIPSIANYMVEELNLRFQRHSPPLPPRILQGLQKREWSGNIRELENLMARYVLLGVEETFKTEIPERWASRLSSVEVAVGSMPLKGISEQARRDLSRDLILKVLQENRWNRRKTAEVLKISYRTLLYKIREAGLPSNRLRARAANGSEPMPAANLPGD